MAIYYVATSLDGFIADTNDDVGWLDELPQPEPETYTDFIQEIGALAMGRATYQFLLRHIEAGGTWPYQQPTWVFTHQTFPPRPGVHFVQGNIADHYPDMAKHGKVWVVGGGELAAQFHDAGHLDECIITVAATTLGNGKPLFPRRTKMEITSTRSLGEGFIEIRCKPQPTQHNKPPKN